MARVTSGFFAGKAILEIDFDGCVPGTFAPVIAEAQQHILRAPPGSVLALTVFENVRFDPSTVAEMRRFATITMPNLRANALLGITGLKKIVFQGVKPFYKVPVELFEDRTQARTWLAAR
jgi:hypothetical protein